ncbi:hypothetical protein [Cognatiyoonia sp. IB215182]|uniref:hypothetical protein n=1 Tax=Cognatiyoonia sp. IB215182 TaxID=3097353 RepID=UPI002A0BDBB0|nr:hypothetical protein [Cognatiyoonia sp. IB215182]MDX8354308.1 hypothetical protein [Cognatiyoonia sp. IB215182]
MLKLRFLAMATIAVAMTGPVLPAYAQSSSDVIGPEISPTDLPPIIDKDAEVFGPETPSEGGIGEIIESYDPSKPKSDLPEVTEAVEGGSPDGSGEIKDDTLPREASLEERMSIAQAEIKALQDRVAENRSAIAELQMLLEEDRDVEPRPAEGAPPIMVSCNEDPDCQVCIAEVAAEMETHLVVYERLRAIYTRYKTFQSRVIIVGDMLAGFHSVSQNAWGGEKVRMQEQLAGLQRAYDAKLAELVDHLRGLLQRVEDCHPPDAVPAELVLHQRLFVSFITNAYRRND